MPINDLIARYCATASAARPQPGEVAPQQNSAATMGNHRVEAFIDGIVYFKAVDQEITNLLNSAARSRFFYLSAWWLGLFHATNTTLKIDDDWEFPLDAGGFILPGSNQGLLIRLVAMAQAGVNVRVIGWISPFIANQRVAQASGIGGVNFHTLMSVDALRKLLPGPEHVLLNMLAHSMGAAHYKMIVCGDQNSMRAYVSGLDPQDSRLLEPGLYDTGHVDSSGQPLCRRLARCRRQGRGQRRRRDPRFLP